MRRMASSLQTPSIKKEVERGLFRSSSNHKKASKTGRPRKDSVYAPDPLTLKELPAAFRRGGN